MCVCVCVCVCARARASVWCDVLCVYVLACAYTRARCVCVCGGGGREGGEIVNFDYVLIQVLCFVMDYELQSPDIAKQKTHHYRISPSTHPPTLPPKAKSFQKHRTILSACCVTSCVCDGARAQTDVTKSDPTTAPLWALGRTCETRRKRSLMTQQVPARALSEQVVAC